MNAIFLDVDGVIAHGNNFCPDALAQLKRIVEKTNCILILSSDRRKNIDQRGEVQRALENVGIPPCICQTPKMNAPRSKEISEWLQLRSHRFDVTKYAILDDQADAKQHHKPEAFFQVFGSLKSDMADKIIKYFLENQ